MQTAADDGMTAQGRLIILRELAAQLDARLNEIALLQALDVFGLRKSRDWLRTQLAALAELGALRITEAGTVWVATLRAAGRAHVDRRTLLSGVARPADEN